MQHSYYTTDSLHCRKSQPLFFHKSKLRVLFPNTESTGVYELLHYLLLTGMPSWVQFILNFKSQIRLTKSEFRNKEQTASIKTKSFTVKYGCLTQNHPGDKKKQCFHVAQFYLFNSLLYMQINHLRLHFLRPVFFYFQRDGSEKKKSDIKKTEKAFRTQTADF